MKYIFKKYVNSHYQFLMRNVVKKKIVKVYLGLDIVRIVLCWKRSCMWNNFITSMFSIFSIIPVYTHWSTLQNKFM